MYLKKLTLKNFRCFSDLELELDPKLTVIIADNGKGKTAVLDAIATGFGRLLTKLGKKGHTLKSSDLQVLKGETSAPYVSITLEIAQRQDENQPSLVWSLTRKRDPSSKIDIHSWGTKAIDEVATSLLQAQNQGVSPDFPLVVYYGTNRAILDEVQRRRNFRKKFMPLDAFDGALEPTARFKTAFEWFNAMEDEERREKERKQDFNYRLPQLNYVRGAIKKALNLFPEKPIFDTPESIPTLFDNLRTETRPLRFVIDQQLPTGEIRTLRIHQLSDGYRTMLGLVMDLARRHAEMYSYAPQVIHGFHLWRSIVLIDEIDLHLHPRWQQTVLPRLQKIFPHAQFIVTTHSPQVLSTVPREQIRVLSDNSAEMPLGWTYGQPSGDVMHAVMGVDEQAPITEKPSLDELTALVDTGQYHQPRVAVLFATLETSLGEHHPQLLTLKRNIRRMEALKRATSA